jgi:predicted AAA+ superfamily ATPase
MAWDRKISHKIIEYKKNFRAVAIMGVRQSGKTTICKEVFGNYKYHNFENINTQNYALEQPLDFLNDNSKGVILDEVQRVPYLFNYLQEILDNVQERGTYILTGSSNFLLNEKITQSLAGRVGYIDMYPLSYEEIKKANDFSIWHHVFYGGFPEVWVNELNPAIFYPNYIQTVVERDIRQLVNINKINLFQSFIAYIATLVGQEINYSKIGLELGIDSKTVQAWIGYLKVAGIIYLLPPYYSNFGKRVVKRSKLYFIDTGIVCALLKINEKYQLEHHPLKGSLFENYCIINLVKQNSYQLTKSNFYFWRSNNGVEVDLIIEKGMDLSLIEIKAGSNFYSKWFKNIELFKSYSKIASKQYVIYTGKDHLNYGENQAIIPYEKMATILSKIE